MVVSFSPLISAGIKPKIVLISRIEVIKEPASVLYGTDALGGVINVITKRPDFAKAEKWTFLNSVEGRYSSVDEGWFGRYALSGGGCGFDFELAVTARDANLSLKRLMVTNILTSPIRAVILPTWRHANMLMSLRLNSTVLMVHWSLTCLKSFRITPE